MFTKENYADLSPFAKKIWLSSPTMHREELEWVEEAIRTNWVSTVGENVDRVEEKCAGLVGRKYAVGLSCGTAALHLAIKLCGEKLYGHPKPGHGTLEGRRVFCSDMTFAATVNPVLYEGGEPVFIDTDPDTWNMDPAALEEAFRIYPDVKLVVIAHLYGFTGDLSALVGICRAHGALIVEDAAESFGASFDGKQTGAFGDASVLSFNGNKIVTGSAGGALLTDSREDADKARKWSTQSREKAPWYQHEELGYNYRMSNVVAGIVRGNLEHLSEHIAQKKAIYERYREGFADLPVSMNPVIPGCEPNYWLSCMILEPRALCRSVRGDFEALYVGEPGKTCPTEILDTLARFNAEGRPIWKPMHLQPIYRTNPFVTVEGNGRAQSDAYVGGSVTDAGADIFARGLCLPSDNKMTAEEQTVVIELIRRLFADAKRG